MSKYAVYCKCKNTYTNKCNTNSKKCKTHPIWEQGIGNIYKKNEQE